MGRSGLTPGLTSGGRYVHLVLLENKQPRAFTGSPHGRSVEDSDSKALVSSEKSVRTPKNRLRMWVTSMLTFDILEMRIK